MLSLHGREVVLHPRHAARLLLLAARRAGTLNVGAIDVGVLRALFDPAQPRDDQGQWTDGGSNGYPRDGQVSQAGLDQRFPRASATVDGRVIPDFDDEFGPDVPNMGSISASLTDYEILDGVREVKMSEFEDGKPSFYSVTEEARVKELAAAIQRNGRITPLIVVVDKDQRGPYVLEGGHRLDALKLIGAKSFPALVVVDTEELRVLEFNPDQPRDDQGQWTSGGGSFTPDATEVRLIDNWAWPNASPVGFGLDYERLRDPKTDEGRQMTQLLGKLPVHDGVTYRGLSLSDPKDVERLVSAKGYELKLHSSASTDFDTAVLFADSQSIGGREQAVIMEMHGRGRAINDLLPEDLQSTKEVVMMAGTRYKFASLSHEEHQGLAYTRVVLKEQR